MCDCLETIDNNLKKERPNLFEPKVAFNIVFSKEGKPSFYPEIRVCYKKHETNKQYKYFPLVPLYCPFLRKKILS